MSVVTAEAQPGIVPPQGLLLAIAAFLVAPVLVLTHADPDLWGHVRFGIDLLHQRALTSIDPYSFTQDLPWVNHEWLSELVMGAAFKAAGPMGLVALKTALVGIVIAIIAAGYAGLPFTASIPVLLLAIVGTARVTSTLRPQLWTLIGVGLLCRAFTRRPRRSWAIGIPLLFAAWANLHGGWVVGAGLLAIWTAGELVRPQVSRGLAVAIAMLSAAATLVNPYGWRLWLFLASTVRLSRNVTEWQPLTTTPIVAWIPWAIVVAGTLYLTMSAARPPLPRLAMIAMLAYASARVERLAAPMVVAAAVLLAPTLRERFSGRRLRFEPLTRGAAAALAALVLALVAGSGVAIARAASCIPLTAGDSWAPDLEAGRALLDARVQGTMVTSFNWGEYIIWHLGPSLRVSLDGRRETVYSDAVLAAHEAIDAGMPEGLAYLQQLDPQYVWLPAGNVTVRNWLEQHGYRIDISTAQSFVAVRRDQTVVRPSKVPVKACFPAP
jgi:hypothetical protein